MAQAQALGLRICRRAAFPYLQGSGLVSNFIHQRRTRMMIRSCTPQHLTNPLNRNEMASHDYELVQEDTYMTDLNELPFATQHSTDSNLTINDTIYTTASSISNSALEADLRSHTSSSIAATNDAERESGSMLTACSLIYDFVKVHGRTFHRYREGKYPLPNDAMEQERLDFQHQFMLILLNGKLHLAPIKEPRLVLDVGTGTGIWAIDFANEYPSASVIGTDLSPIQPALVPLNCQFEIDDAEDEWLYTKNFDYIHMRGMMTCFSDPRSVMQSAFEHCAPGGYVEMQDGMFPLKCHDDTLEGTALDEWAKACTEAGARTGRRWDNAVRYKQWMIELGFVDVKEKVFEVPTNTWPMGRKAKELGRWFQYNVLDGLSASKVLLAKAMGWPVAKVELLLMEVRNDLKNKDVHAYMQMSVLHPLSPIRKLLLTFYRYIIFGRKPAQDNA